METPHMAPAIYLPEKPLKKAAVLINPNCGKGDTRFAFQPAPLSYSRKISFILKSSSKIKLSKIKLLPFNWVWIFCYLERITH